MIPRKYLLKLEGRSTGNYEIFNSYELDKLIEFLTSAVAFNDVVFGKSQSPDVDIIRKLIEVLKYTKPSE